MRISKTSGRAAPKVAKSNAASKSKSKSRAKKNDAAAQLNHTPAPSQLSGLKLAMQRLADGISNLQSKPLSGLTAQDALANLRGE
jgi:hypothetical protein